MKCEFPEKLKVFIIRYAERCGGIEATLVLAKTSGHALEISRDENCGTPSVSTQEVDLNKEGIIYEGYFCC